MSRHIAVVGNGPLVADADRLIDSADHVIRFNKAIGLGRAAGSRTNELYLVNHGGQMAEWLAQGQLVQQPAVRAVVAASGTIVLPVPLLPGHLSAHDSRRRVELQQRATNADRINHLVEARALLESCGARVDEVSLADYRRAQRILKRKDAARGEPFPSTGFIALMRTLRRRTPSDRIALFGFSFQGWSGHRWSAEQTVIMQRAARGELAVHLPPDAGPVRGLRPEPGSGLGQ